MIVRRDYIFIHIIYIKNIAKLNVTQSKMKMRWPTEDSKDLR